MISNRMMGNLLVASLVAVFIGLLTFVSESNSCTRGEAPRQALRLVAAAAYWARTEDALGADEAGDRGQAARYRQLANQYLDAWRAAAPLDCGLPWPDSDAADADGLPPNPLPVRLR